MKLSTSTHCRKTATVFALALLYSVLFYHAELGLNLLLFDAILILTMLKVTPELARHPGVQSASAGLLFSAFTVVIVHSPVAILAHHLTFVLLVGFAQARELRFVLYGLSLGIITLCRGPWEWIRSARTSIRPVVETSPVGRAIPYLAAGLIATPFALLYLAGNDILNGSMTWFIDGLSAIEFNVSFFWAFLLATFSALLVTSLFFHRSTPSKLVARQATFKDELDPGRGNEFDVYPQPDVAPERLPEARIGLFSLIALNALLFIVNGTDLGFVWLNTSDLPAATLSHYVHAGTDNLIVSVCLAIIVVLYFFRGHLNWLGDGKLQWAAKVWVGQNALLLTSVAFKNFRYVEAYGLAMGRVYIIVALLVLAFGLMTLYRKVTQKLSLTYLFQANTTALWLTLLLFGAVNWPGVITRYNLATQPEKEVDWAYLYNGFDGRNDFLLAPLATNQSIQKNRIRTYDCYTDIRSWNYSDYRNLKAYERNKNRFKAAPAWRWR